MMITSLYKLPGRGLSVKNRKPGQQRQMYGLSLALSRTDRPPGGGRDTSTRTHLLDTENIIN